MYRQGDVLLVPVEVPLYPNEDLDFVRRKGNGEGIILAAGEATGHHHRIRDRHAREFRGTARSNTRGRRFVRVSHRGATITHEEHDPIKVPEGMYEIVQQREFAPEEASLTRPVYD
jgi:hypothetical protein